MIGAVRLVLRRYASFTGRAAPAELWWWVLACAILFFVLSTVANSADFGVSRAAAAVLGVLWLATIVPSFAVGMRRLHDTGRSEWMMLLVMVPLIGPLALLAFWATPGTAGVNRYGPDPKGRDEVRPQPQAPNVAYPAGGASPLPPGTTSAWPTPQPQTPPAPQTPQTPPPAPPGQPIDPWTGPPPSWGPPPGQQG